MWCLVLLFWFHCFPFFNNFVVCVLYRGAQKTKVEGDAYNNAPQGYHHPSGNVSRASESRSSNHLPHHPLHNAPRAVFDEDDPFGHRSPSQASDHGGKGLYRMSSPPRTPDFISFFFLTSGLRWWIHFNTVISGWSIKHVVWVALAVHQSVH
jgi:hypothetical protein